MDTANQIKQDNQYNLRRLVAGVKASLNTFNLLICISDTLECRNDIIEHYESELRQHEIMCSRVSLDRSSLSLKQSLQSLIAEQTNLLYVKSVVTVLGADELFGIELKNWGSDTDRFFFSLQWTREALMQFKVPIVIWMDPQTADGAATSAPDFWSWRGGIFRFQAPVKKTSSISQFNDRRRQHLEKIVSRYYEQLAALENVVILSASEDKVRIRQRIENLKAEMQAYEQELGRLNLKNNPRKSLLSIFDRIHRIESHGDSLFQEQIRILSEDYERVFEQLSITIDVDERVRLERQLDQLEERLTLLLYSTIAQEGRFVLSKNVMNVMGGQGLQVNEKQDQPIIQIQW